MIETGGGSFRGIRARRIAWQSWSPAGDQQPKGVVSIAHGYGEHIGRYGHVAARLCEAGFVVYGADHHGHGQSGGKRGRIRLDAAIADLDQLIVTVSRERHPGLPQFLLGHSMGGLIALRYAVRHAKRLDGLVVTAPLAEVEGGNGLHTLARILGMVLPGAPVSKIDPRLISRDPAVVADYASDPLNHHGPIVAAVAREFVLATSRLPAEVQLITPPTLLMWGTDDRLCPPSGAEMVAASIGSDDLTVERFPGLFHEIMNEPEQAKVLDAIVVWLDAHVPQAAATGAGNPRT